MALLLVNLISPVITGCIVALFTHWLGKRDKKNNRR
ncbi:type I toxin-antitoxin system Fst family toxin [Staphylococcus pettenkoferi]|nr:type I toxin-antitoxin system Fst family toxin [Staphylococcus pettenkoferi]